MSSSLILRAARFAAQSHAGQFRKDGVTPYIFHPMRVAGRASMLYGVPEYVVAAGWLHDVIEDCGIEAHHIARLLGFQTAHLVLELTNPSKPYHGIISRAECKQMDREHLGKVSTWAKCLKCIDRIDNLGEVHSQPESFIRLYLKESLLLRDALAYLPSTKTQDDVLERLLDELTATMRRFE